MKYYHYLLTKLNSFITYLLLILAVQTLSLYFNFIETLLPLYFGHREFRK